jgi:hypothetical protein
MRLAIATAPLLVVSALARAQPADCPPAPGQTAGIPLWVDFAGMPGVPRGVSGYAGVTIPAPPPGGETCVSPPPVPARDVLRGAPGNALAGPPGNALRGQGPRDLLGGGTPTVEIETR